MLVLRIVAGVALGYGLIVLLAWLLQERLAFPAPRAPVPDPRRLGIANGERIHLYGRSLGTAVASYTAARHPVAGLILESPFTSAAAMARHLYPFLPRLGLRLSLDNLGHVRLVRCPVLLLHGTADRLAPTAMGMAVAAAAASPVEVVLIHGAGHNDTYDVGGREYRDKLWGFVAGR